MHCILKFPAVGLDLGVTQFEIERGSCGQSMTNFRFFDFSCEGQNNFTGCQSFLCKNVHNKFSFGSALGTLLTY